MKTYTQKEVVKMLADTVKRHGRGGSKMTAAAIYISPTYISNVLRGSQAPGPAILQYIGLRKIKGERGLDEPIYEPIQTELFEDLVQSFEKLHDGDPVTVEFPHNLAKALRLLHRDFIKNGLVCSVCDTIIPEGHVSCPKCGRWQRHTRHEPPG